jgi:hypothetical protein
MSHLVSRLAAALLAVAVATPTLAAEVDRRAERQQQRIAEGVESGQLTPHETARLERKEARIDHQIKRERAANGGTLTPAEKAHINREQDHVSRQIYAQKHDAQHR